ncbi:armadillo-type protein [Hysterangium stoloniferum]|nr:armadillo-type protein [Hysterangium stoloniferum]
MSERAEFRATIEGVITPIVALLKESNFDVQSSAVSILGMVSEQARLGATIAPVIPDIVTLLKDSDSDIQSQAVSALEKVSEQGAFTVWVLGTFSKQVALVNISKQVHKLANFSEQAEFQAAIRPGIPDIVAFLKDSDCSIQSSTVSTLAKFLEQESAISVLGVSAAPHPDRKWKGERAGRLEPVEGGQERQIGSIEGGRERKPMALRDWHWSGIKINMTKMANLHLQLHPGLGVRDSAYDWKISEQARLGATIAPAIPNIVALLKDSSSDILSSAVSGLGKVSEQMELRAAIAPAIPTIAPAIPTIAPAIPTIVPAIPTIAPAIPTIVPAIPTIAPAIPAIIALLEESNHDIQSSAVLVYFRARCILFVRKISGQAEFRAAIEGVIPTIVALLKDSDIRSSAVSVLGKVSEQGAVYANAKLQAIIESVIPTIVALLEDANYCVRSSAVLALGKVLEQVTMCDKGMGI